MAQIPLPKLLKRKKRQTKAVKGAKRRRDNTVKRLVRKVKSGAHPNNIAKWRQNRRERNADLQEARGKRSYTDQQIKRAKQASTRPSPNFAYAEFDCKDGTPVPKASYPALDFLCTTYLEPLREKFGAVRVTSGHRHERYNANLRPPGATQSLHIYDFPRLRGGANTTKPLAVAADIYCAKGTPAQWAAFLETLNPGGLCPYPNNGFVHIDTRQRIGMPRSRGWL